MPRVFATTLATLLLFAVAALATTYTNNSTGQQSPGYVPESTPGTPYSGTNPLPVGAGTITITQTIVTLSAATSATLIAANASRKYLKWCDIGTAPMTVAPGAVTVTAGQGVNYDPGSSASNQGGCETMESSSISKQAFSAISTAGTTVAVWEGQ